MNSKQTAMVAAKARTDSSKSPAARARRDAAQAELIARRKEFEAKHLDELRDNNPQIRAQYYAIK